MNKILIITIFLSSSIFANNLPNLEGSWYFSSKKEKKGIVFGFDMENDKKIKFSLNFNKNKIALVENDTNYFYKKINDKLYISKTKKKLFKAIEYNDLENVDIFKESGKYKGCIVLKYTHKGMRTFYDKNGYKLCKAK